MVKNAAKASINPLRDLEGDKCFWVHNGPVIKNLYELHSSLESMDEATFKHHVNEEKNDLYNWLEYAVQDKKLADRIMTLKTKEQIAESVKERIDELAAKPKTKAHIKRRIKEAVKQGIKKVQLKAIKKSRKKEYSRIKVPRIEHGIGAKPFSMVGTLIALITVFVVVGAINISKAVITGAAIADIKNEASPLVSVLIIASVIALVIAGIKKTKKSQ